MEKDLVKGNIGNAGTYDVAFTGGKLIAKASFGIGAEVDLSIDSDLILDAIAKAIPGQIDDAIISVVKAALKV